MIVNTTQQNVQSESNSIHSIETDRFYENNIKSRLMRIILPQRCRCQYMVMVNNESNYSSLNDTMSEINFNFTKIIPDKMTRSKVMHRNSVAMKNKNKLMDCKYCQKLNILSSIEQILSIKTFLRGILTTLANFNTVDANNIKNINVKKDDNSDNLLQEHNQQIKNNINLTTRTTSTMTMSNTFQDDTISNTFYTDMYDMNFTSSVSEVLLVPTLPSPVIPATISLSSLSSSTSSSSPSSLLITGSEIIISAINGSDYDGITEKGNVTDDDINSFYFYETEQFTVLWILFIVIVLGNSAVLVTLFMNKNRKSRMNFFIKQLAIADLLVGLLNVLTDIIWRITVSWRAGNIPCKLIRFSQVCVTYASTYVLVALSIDRYDAITHPMNFSGSWQRARRLVGCAWFVSALFSSPMLFLYEEKLIQKQQQCWIELGKPWRWQLYMSLVSATLFFCPALIITACYAIIVRTIWVKGAVFIPAERTRGCSSSGGIGAGGGAAGGAGGSFGNHASRRASSRGIIPRAKVKTVKMTFVIVIVFVVCWSPYIIFDLLQVFGQIPHTQTNIAIATFIQSLAPLNSAANPLIYCLFSTQVCRALKRIPPFRWIPRSCCCCCCYCCGYCKSGQGRNSAPIRCSSVGQRLHNSCDSMRTLTTSLTMSRRSNNNCMRPSRVVIVERPKTILAMSEV